MARLNRARRRITGISWKKLSAALDAGNTALDSTNTSINSRPTNGSLDSKNACLDGINDGDRVMQTTVDNLVFLAERSSLPDPHPATRSRSRLHKAHKDSDHSASDSDDVEEIEPRKSKHTRGRSLRFAVNTLKKKLQSKARQSKRLGVGDNTSRNQRIATRSTRQTLRDDSGIHSNSSNGSTAASQSTTHHTLDGDTASHTPHTPHTPPRPVIYANIYTSSPLPTAYNSPRTPNRIRMGTQQLHSRRELNAGIDTLKHIGENWRSILDEDNYNIRSSLSVGKKCKQSLKTKKPKPQQSFVFSRVPIYV